MNKLSIRGVLAAVLVFAVLAGCSRNINPVQHPPLRKIGILPVNPPPELSTRNDNFFANLSGIASIAMASENRSKSNDFSTRMLKARSQLGQRMTTALMEELPKQGYEVELVDRVAAYADDPEDFDYTKLSSHGPVVHVWYDDVGMYSPITRVDYVPRINVTVRLVYPLEEDFVYDEVIYYGADSRGDKYWSVPADPKYQFRSYDSLVGDPDKVEEAFDVGIRAIAAHAGKQFRRAVK